MKNHRCPGCNAERFPSGHAPSGAAYYRTAGGRFWRGVVCPGCKKDKVSPTVRMEKRYCRKCGNLNPPSRYFTCSSCVPELESEDVWFESWEMLGEINNTGAGGIALTTRLLKRCSRCKKKKPHTEYGHSEITFDKYRTRCKECENEVARKKVIARSEVALAGAPA